MFSFKNYVKIEGYLADTNLKVVYLSDNTKAISGSITILTGINESHHVHFFAPEKRNSELFRSLNELITTYKNNMLCSPYGATSATFKQATQSALYLMIVGHFEEVITQHSSVTIVKGSMCYIRGIVGEMTMKDYSIVPTIFGPTIKEDSVAFKPKPKADFEVEMYIERMEEEKIQTENSQSEKLSGRLIITGLVPSPEGTMNRIEFIAPQNATEYIQQNYAISNIVIFSGILRTNRITISKTNSIIGFIETEETRYKLKLERLIQGSSLALNDNHSITLGDVKSGLLKREEKIKKFSSRYSN